MDDSMQKILHNLAEETLSSPFFASLSRPEYEQAKVKLEGYFQDLLMDILIDNLNEKQLEELERVGFDSPQSEELVTLYAAGIPNFLEILEVRLKEETEKIGMSGKIPQLN